MLLSCYIQLKKYYDSSQSNASFRWICTVLGCSECDLRICGEEKQPLKIEWIKFIGNKHTSVKCRGGG